MKTESVPEVADGLATVSSGSMVSWIVMPALMSATVEVNSVKNRPMLMVSLPLPPLTVTGTAMRWRLITSAPTWVRRLMPPTFAASVKLNETTSRSPLMVPAPPSPPPKKNPRSALRRKVCLLAKATGGAVTTPKTESCNSISPSPKIAPSLRFKFSLMFDNPV